ncbi:MAG: PaaI family thioesterase [Syntrophales bacterium]
MREREGVRQLPKMENHLCFGCGPANEHGLNMQFFGDGTSVHSWITVPGHLCGWNNLIHGGIISTLLDEIMSGSVVYVLRTMGMTRSLSVDFIRPVQAGTEIKVESRILEVKNGREATVEGILCDESGEICAKSTGTYVLFSSEKIRKMGIVTDDVVEWFERFIQGRETVGQKLS